MNNMCWCKYCKWYYKEHCANGLRDNCTEMVGDYNSCEHSELKDSIDTEYQKGYSDGAFDGYVKGYDKANGKQIEKGNDNENC